MSPTERTLKELRKRGYKPWIVEKWNQWSRKRIDMWNVLDVVAVGNGQTVGVQCTSGSNVSARVQKIAEAEITPVLRECGWKLVVWGWSKRADGKYHLREVDCS